jgi:ABC-type Fe3+/spermidine/putrescine transport system ATPase subunit
MSAPGRVRLTDLSLSHGGRQVVHAIDLDVAPGEFICLLGPSGCGKTTTLRAIAGLHRVAAGTVEIDGVVANQIQAHRRNIAMVFQDLALFPHMTVIGNIAFGLLQQRLPSEEIQSRIARMLSLLHLKGLENRLPRQLSGGQQQRVAIARSLVVQPAVLLLDEPFAALDRKLREEMRREIRALQRKLGLTAVFVTHDQEEALTMADRVVVMNHGAIEQVGTPDEIYERPASRFVLDFVGQTNFLSVERDGDAFRLAGQRLRATGGRLAGSPLQLAVRPERIGFAETMAAAANRVNGRIDEVAYEGALVTFGIVLADGQRLDLRSANLGAAQRRGLGEEAAVAWRPEDTLLIEGG